MQMRVWGKQGPLDVQNVEPTTTNYASTVWDISIQSQAAAVEEVQRRAARCIMGNYRRCCYSTCTGCRSLMVVLSLSKR
jgi:hypothetical protein